MHTIIQSFTLGALLKIKIRILDSIYRAEKVTEEPSRNGECVVLFDGRKAPTEKFGLEFIRSYRKMQKLEETLYYLR